MPYLEPRKVHTLSLSVGNCVVVNTLSYPSNENGRCPNTIIFEREKVALVSRLAIDVLYAGSGESVTIFPVVGR